MNTTYKLNTITYTITPCTAIAECDNGDEASRQDALLVVAATESGETNEQLVFGWAMPQTSEAFADMCEDSGAWEAVCDDYDDDGERTTTQRVTVDGAPFHEWLQR